METCQRCGELGEDRRTLSMACFYAMEELNVPFNEEVYHVPKDSGQMEHNPKKFYTLRVCKDCRASWMGTIEQWFSLRPQKIPLGTGIYIREHGATREITQEEWEARHAQN